MIELQFVYYYKGVNCSTVKIKEIDKGYFIAINDYNEQMFSGTSLRLLTFLDDLRSENFA